MARDVLMCRLSRYFRTVGAMENSADDDRFGSGMTCRVESDQGTQSKAQKDFRRESTVLVGLVFSNPGSFSNPGCFTCTSGRSPHRTSLARTSDTDRILPSVERRIIEISNPTSCSLQFIAQWRRSHACVLLLPPWPLPPCSRAFVLRATAHPPSIIIHVSSAMPAAAVPREKRPSIAVRSREMIGPSSAVPA